VSWSSPRTLMSCTERLAPRTFWKSMVRGSRLWMHVLSLWPWKTPVLSPGCCASCSVPCGAFG
jgi:hypothetical protein